MTKSIAAIALGAGLLVGACASPTSQPETDVAAATPVSYQFYRNATAKLTYDGKVLLLDPMLAEKGSLPSFAGIAPNPTIELPVPAAEVISDFDAVIVGHMHIDHFDPVAAEMLPKDSLIYTPNNQAPINPADPEHTTEPFIDQLADMGFTNARTIASDASSSATFEGITLTQEFGAHGEGLVGHLMGGVNGIIFQAEDQPTIYWTGDTVLDEGGRVADVIARYAPDIIIAHPGGALVEAVAPNPLLMNEAQMVEFIELAEAANPEVQIIAVHMNALDHCRTTRESLGEAIAAHPNVAEFDVFLPVEGDLITLR